MFTWTDVAEITVAPFGIVKIVDVIGDGCSQFQRGRPLLRVQEFRLQPPLERLHDRVIEAIADRTERFEQPPPPEIRTEPPRRELRTVIGMQDRCLPTDPFLRGHVHRIVDQCRIGSRGEGTTHDHLTETVQNRTAVNLPATSLDSSSRRNTRD